MKALVFNQRRKIFRDKRVREALTLLFDFEWINRNLYHNLYTRTRSYFDRSELSSGGKPADQYEQLLLGKFPNSVTPAIIANGYTPPVSEGSGRNRKARRKALRLLMSAGYVLKGATLVDRQTGTPFTFEILTAQREQERLLLNFAASLKLVGIKVHLRIVDSAQYQQRKNTFDYDMTDNEWRASLSPGNEQSFRWSAKAADSEGSYNFAGVKNPAVDAMIKAMLAAKSREKFVSSTRRTRPGSLVWKPRHSAVPCPGTMAGHLVPSKTPQDTLFVWIAPLTPSGMRLLQINLCVEMIRLEMAARQMTD